MESVTQLAARLDIAMLQARGFIIHDENVEDDALPECDVTAQVGNRLLIKYVRANDAEKFSKLSGSSKFSGRHWVTPTPIAPNDVRSVLALPPGRKKSHCYSLLLRPDRLTDVYGPRRIAGGFGVEYVLKDGFYSDAIADPGWALEHV